MKNILFVFIVLAIIIVIGFLFFKTKNNNQQVCFEQNCFKIEIAITPAEMERGLMFRESLEQNKGMLFIFDNTDVHPFWMRNTLIPLDIIWLDENQRVVFVEKDCQPCLEKVCPNFAPFVSAKYVLEINSGIAEKIGLSLGEKMELR